jgi:decaprenylphospho-beta-D-ribofuranose 2-oxidase
MLAGWGRFPRIDCRVSRPGDEAALRALVAEGGAIARGNGRAYGDSAMSVTNTIAMDRFSRLLAFDPATGQLVAEAGVLLGDIIAAMLRRGFFPAVVPGTQDVTVGGMIAADVHGKNHHVDGGIGRHLDWIELMGPDGVVRRCRPGEALFVQTVGGMGLSGVIVRAALRLRPVETAYVAQSLVTTPDLGASLDALDAHGEATYSVAWLDALDRHNPGRGQLMLGEHVRREDLPAALRADPLTLPAARRLALPVDLPGVVVNRFSVGLHNRWRYARDSRLGHSIVGWEEFFFPLDRFAAWNRAYGRRGLMQFQCVLPPATARAGVTALFGAMTAAGQGAYLAVLKRLGPADGALSFPMEGHTLALDFPVTAATLSLMERLDAVVLDHGGRFYLAKDSRMSAQTMRRADPRAVAFRAAREASGTATAFASAQSLRLGL